MADIETRPASAQAAKPITLIPVGLKEAALDSPTFRAGFTHFVEQLELVEKWLNGYYRCVSRLIHETGPFESAIDAFIAQTVPPLYASEAILDHDYTLLAVKKYGDCAREIWTAALSDLKKMEANMVEPIRTFIHGDIQSFKDLKRNVETCQKQMDSLQSRLVTQGKTKEPSSLREDAFQLHESRKAYLKASMDFSVAAPQLRMNLDKLLVKVFSDQWRELRGPRLNINSSIIKWGADIDRVRGWSREMENSERTFRRELDTARKRIEEDAEFAIRPSRELEDYAINTFIKQRGPSLSNAQLTGPVKGPRGRAEKQGWLMLRTVAGKPSRTIWVRRWFYVKNGIFGWLVQGPKSGGVEESDRIGVLLCNVTASNSDDRRYVFEVKTKDKALIVQAETQSELSEWLSAFEAAKQKAFEQPELGASGPKQALAFAISPPSAAEFAATAETSGVLPGEDTAATFGVDRSATLPVPGTDTSSRNSFDVSTTRRSSPLDTDGSRDPALRIKSKLDLHKRSAAGTSPTSSGLSGSGIASLIAASHGSMPLGPGALPVPPTPDTPTNRKVPTPLSTLREMPISTLAPSTLANPPAPTNLSATAVVVSGERGIGISRPESSGGVPSGLLANVWGSSNWGFLNRLERGEVDDHKGPSSLYGVLQATAGVGSPVSARNSPSPNNASPTNVQVHRKTISLVGGETAVATSTSAVLEYPHFYPTQLKMQDAQFRLLFPNVPHEEKVVLVFKATWNANDQQEFPGRIYVTPKEIYLYSNHYGMTMTTSIPLRSISEVTAATGRDWDVVFLHLKEAKHISGFTRIMIKTFLEPLKLLQRRLSFLTKAASDESITATEEIMKALISMEQDNSGGNQSDNSWENVSINTPVDGTSTANRFFSHKDQRDLRASVLIDQGLYGNASGSENVKKSKSFKLPRQPVIFVPSKMDQLVVEKEFDISPKALFHVMFGDKSAVWQLLYHERQAQRIRQGPWTQPIQGHLRRAFEYEIEYLDMFRRLRKAHVLDHQTIDSATEYLLYCVSDRKTPWHLPFRKDFVLLSKIVITYVAKAKCRLAIYTKVDWSRAILPPAKAMLSRAALSDMEIDALDLVDVLSDQVRRLVGARGRTKTAVAIFGQIGQQSQVSEFAGNGTPLNARLRRSRKPKKLTSIFIQDLGSLIETMATAVFQLIGNCIRCGWNTISANILILLLLLTSIFLNLLCSSKGLSHWWQERRTLNFMSRLGIGPHQSLSRAVYLHDLSDATNLNSSPNPGPSQSMCKDAFDGLMNLSDSPTRIIASASSRQSQASTALRLQRTRQHLGTRRHNLLVALRIVNSIEREMVKAEWETWLGEENARCHQLGRLLKLNTTEVQDREADKLAGRRKQVTQWYESYCGSCRAETKRIVDL